jgi:hypothetical protein
MNETSVETLISQLRSFRTRSAAADALVAMGRGAVPPLLDALEQEGNEDSTWALLNCLGQIGAIEAVPALARYLEESDYQTVAHDALVKITGRDFGGVATDWVRWMEQKGAAAGQAAVKTGTVQRADGDLTDERLLELALQGSGAGWRAEAENRYAVDVPLPGGGKQRVDVVFGGRDHEGSEIVVVYSLSGEARPDQYEAALRHNLRMPYGALALRESGGKKHFVMFNTILRKDLSPVELRKSVLTVGERSNRVAREL